VVIITKEKLSISIIYRKDRVIRDFDSIRLLDNLFIYNCFLGLPFGKYGEQYHPPLNYRFKEWTNYKIKIKDCFND